MITTALLLPSFFTSARPPIKTGLRRVNLQYRDSQIDRLRGGDSINEKFKQYPFKFYKISEEEARKNRLYQQLFITRFALSWYKLLVHTVIKNNLDLMKGQKAIKYATGMTMCCGVVDRVYYQLVVSDDKNLTTAFDSFKKTSHVDFLEWLIFYSSKSSIETQVKNFLINHLKEEKIKDAILEIGSNGLAGVFVGTPFIIADYLKVKYLKKADKETNNVDFSINYKQLLKLLYEKAGYCFWSRALKVGLQDPISIFLGRYILNTNIRHMLSSFITIAIATTFLLKKETRYIEALVGNIKTNQ